MYKMILVPVDLTAPSRALLQRAVDFANTCNASIHVTYVEPGVSNYSLEDIEIELESVHEANQQKRLQQLRDLCADLPIPPEHIYMTQGNVAGHLIQLASAIHADLVIMGEHHSFWHMQHINRQVEKKLNCDLLTMVL
ncbi:universal stress protein [Echinimonas agarilytica]|uniref:Universal stress protein n=1 Tax=Echinimonas agarilytica TaxID=1215918 RepID=A0AA42B7V2_9GAMM|nr:universal stress protein [Echinimonas agarilytica]MCM2680242.1 universal stress protein [Echinimonas agarilytica]